jgi:hypothetical protein
MVLSSRNFLTCQIYKFPSAMRKTSYKLGTIHLRRLHDLGGGGGSPLPLFADARGAGVLGLPTSAIFETIRRQIRLFWRVSN